jgi:hypothetical protein
MTWIKKIRMRIQSLKHPFYRGIGKLLPVNVPKIVIFYEGNNGGYFLKICTPGILIPSRNKDEHKDQSK